MAKDQQPVELSKGSIVEDTAENKEVNKAENAETTKANKAAAATTTTTSTTVGPKKSEFRKLLLAAILGDLILYLLFRTEIPERDYLVCRLGLLAIILLTALESDNKATPNPTRTNERFRKIFTILSSLEIIFTILLPWMVLLEGIFNKRETAKNGHLLAAHLFIFQAQIAGECIIYLAGEKRRWMVFPFTCVANSYRVVTIGTWLRRTMEGMNDDETNNNELGMELSGRDIALPVIAAMLWVYSSFFFIPHEWYPLLKNKV